MPARSQCEPGFRLIATVIGVVALAPLAIPAQPAAKQTATLPKERYLSPIEMAFSKDGRELYVVCQDSDEMRVVDMALGKVSRKIPVGHVPRGVALSPDGRRIYVT